MVQAKAVQTHLLCKDCGNVSTIFRLISRQKAFGHTKHLWCNKCKDRTAHFEDNRKYV